eukprot:scaffold350_cov333-Pavlova_lutheri.AAC.38
MGVRRKSTGKGGPHALPVALYCPFGVFDARARQPWTCDLLHPELVLPLHSRTWNLRYDIVSLSFITT